MRRFSIMTCGLIALLFSALPPMLIPSMAHAADTATTVSLSPVWDALLQILLPVVSAILLALIAWIGTIIRAKFGIDIEAKHRDALHSAIMTGVTAALAKVGTKVDAVSIDVRSPVVAEAISWAEQSVPGAIKALGVTPDGLATLATAKLQQLLTPEPTVVNVTSAPATSPISNISR